MNLKKLSGRNPKPAIYRFNMSHVKDQNTGCWIWQGRSRSGSCRLYGKIKVNKKSMAAHRFSWELHNGKKIPHGMIVMHKCDNPECVNPDHLMIGTHADNAKDKVVKNRQAKGDDFKNRAAAKGEKVGTSKLTDSLALKIFFDSRPQRKIAKDYNVTQTTVSNIKLKKIWRHIHE